MSSKPHKYYLDELLFLKENFYKLTNAQLLEHINANRTRKVSMSAMLHKCRSMGLSNGIQIRWSDEDARYIARNFREMGNFELAIRLNKRRKTYRIIDGKKVYRRFTKKHVEKKLHLMGLYRTDEEVRKILIRNIEKGYRPAFSKDDNLYTRGIKKVADEYETKIWNHDNRRIRVIKVNGQFIPYSRWFYESKRGRLPEGWNVYHKDMDPLNDSIENLYACPMSSNTYGDYIAAKDLLKARISKHHKIKRITREDEHKWQLELTRLRKLSNKVTEHIERVNENSIKHGYKIFRKPRFQEVYPGRFGGEKRMDMAQKAV